MDAQDLSGTAAARDLTVAGGDHVFDVRPLDLLESSDQSRVPRFGLARRALVTRRQSFRQL